MTTGNGKVLLCFDNKLDTATLTASSEASSSTTVQNLKDYRPGVQWVATGHASEWVKADHGQTEVCSVVIIWNHNGTANAQVQIEKSDVTDFSVDSYNQTFDLWTATEGLGEGGLGETGLGGYPALSAFAAWSPYRVIIIPERPSGRYTRLTFLDPSNTVGFRAGRVFVGDYSQTGINFLPNWQMGREGSGSSKITGSGSVRLKKGRKRRILTINWDFADRTDWKVFDDLGRIIGIDGSMFVVPFPDDDLAWQYRTTVYGVPATNGPIQGANQSDLFSFTLSVREFS